MPCCLFRGGSAVCLLLLLMFIFGYIVFVDFCHLEKQTKCPKCSMSVTQRTQPNEDSEFGKNEKVVGIGKTGSQTTYPKRCPQNERVIYTKDG